MVPALTMREAFSIGYGMEFKDPLWHGYTDEQFVDLLNKGVTHAALAKRVGLRAPSVSAHVKTVRKRSPHLVIYYGDPRKRVDAGIARERKAALTPREAAKVQLADLMQAQREIKYDRKSIKDLQAMTDLLTKTVKMVAQLYPDEVSKDLIATSEAAGGSTLLQRMQDNSAKRDAEPIAA